MLHVRKSLHRLWLYYRLRVFKLFGICTVLLLLTCMALVVFSNQLTHTTISNGNVQGITQSKTVRDFKQVLSSIASKVRQLPSVTPIPAYVPSDDMAAQPNDNDAQNDGWGERPLDIAADALSVDNDDGSEVDTWDDDSTTTTTTTTTVGPPAIEIQEIVVPVAPKKPSAFDLMKSRISRFSRVQDPSALEELERLHKETLEQSRAAFRHANKDPKLDEQMRPVPDAKVEDDSDDQAHDFFDLNERKALDSLNQRFISNWSDTKRRQDEEGGVVDEEGRWIPYSPAHLQRDKVLNDLLVVWDFGAAGCTGWFFEAVNLVVGMHKMLPGLGIIIGYERDWCPGIAPEIRDILLKMSQFQRPLHTWDVDVFVSHKVSTTRTCVHAIGV